MRFVDRALHPPPPWLADPSDDVAEERTGAKDYYAPGGRRPAYPFKEYKNYAVGQALLAMFDGKCAYCESKVAGTSGKEIEHYRPKGGVAGDDAHDGYWWLASEWSNLLPSCTGCNQGRRQHLVTPDMREEDFLARVAAAPRTKVGKHKQFPVAGTRATSPECDLSLEDPLLIDPSVRDPSDALRWASPRDYSVVLPAQVGGAVDPRGAATIEICALNRSDLVKDRTELLAQLRYFRTEILGTLQRDGSDAGKAHALAMVGLLRTFAAKDRPYSAMARAYVDEVLAEIDLWLARRQAGTDGAGAT